MQKTNIARKTVNEINLRRLEFFPDVNPLIEGEIIPLKTAQVRSTFSNTPLANAKTGELVGTSVIHQIKTVDQEHFVKIFLKGVIAMHELSRSASRVFYFILQLYEAEPLDRRGYNETIYLAPIGKTISSNELPFSKQVWTRGFKELLFKNFLAPRSPYVYWVNPSLFFKGNRAILVTELRKAQKPKQVKNEQPK